MSQPWDEPEGSLCIAQVVSGMKVARARLGRWYGTWEPVAPIRRLVGAGVMSVRVGCEREYPKQQNLRGAEYWLRGTGTDRLVVVVMPGNAGGAKGTACSPGRAGGQLCRK